jgi:probable phosphoglycerate mutase
VPLTATGRDQARAIADHLAGIRFAAVLSSPLARALDTAREAGFADAVKVDPDLAEWDYGAYEGLTTNEIRREVPGWTIWRDGPSGGETAADVALRLARVLGRVRRIDGNVAVFAHGHVLRALAARWLGLRVSAGRLFALGTATVSVLGWEHETRVIESWNEACRGR